MENFKVTIQKGFKMRSIAVANFGYTIHQRNFSQISYGFNSKQVTENQMHFAVYFFNGMKACASKKSYKD